MHNSSKRRFSAGNVQSRPVGARLGRWLVIPIWVGICTWPPAWSHPPGIYGLGTPESLGPVVNSSGSDRGPSLSGDGLSLYFHSSRSGGFGNHDIWMTTRENPTAPWQRPVNLGATVNTGGTETWPTISHDGLSLFFADWAPSWHTPGDLWVSKRSSVSAPWRAPVSLSLVNSDFNEAPTALTSDGLTLFYSSQRPPGSTGNADLWMTTRSASADPQQFGPPVHLGPIVNGASSDSMPGVSGDGRTLVFSSNRLEVGNMNWALWVTTRESASAAFREPANLGLYFPEGFSSTYDPAISADGSTLFFSSNGLPRSDSINLWQVPLQVPQPVELNGRGDSYVQGFDEALGMDGTVSGTKLPQGWYVSNNGSVFENATTASIPVGRVLPPLQPPHRS